MAENEGVPQFQTAEFEQPATPDGCCVCHQPISGAYYRIGGRMACSACAQQVLARKPADSHAAFSRAVLFGLGGALLGLILYSAVGILLHIEIGFISLAVGWLVGKAMMAGSGNIGGRRYQWAAVLLTYAAVSLSAVPILISQNLHPREEANKPVIVATPSPAPANSGEAVPAAPAAPPAQSGAPADANQESANAPDAKPMSAGKAVLVLLGIGLVSPFLELAGSFAHGAIGLIILFVGVQIAGR